MKKVLIVFIAVLLMVCGFAVAEECAHNMVVTTTGATCTSPAVVTESCTICGFTDSWKSGSELGHDWGSEKKVSDATCQAAAVYQLTCSRCQQTKTESRGSVSGHNIKTETISGATCTAAAVVREYCTTCDYSKTVTSGSALGHDHVVSVKEATCLNAKTYTETCSRCKTVIDTWTEGTALNHNHNVGVKSEATCTSAKVMYEYCDKCDTILDTWTEGAPIDHTIVVELVSAADCVNPEMSKKVCSVCTYEEAPYVSAPAKGHTSKVVPAVAPTCTETGLAEGAVCGVCGVELKAQAIVAATGHDWYKRVVEPTASKRGYTEYACVNAGCDEYFRTDYTDVVVENAVAADVALNPYGSIVTDLDDVEKPYTAELDAEGKHLCIIAKPAEDGTYQLRELHLSLALIEELKAEGIEEICFVVGETDIDVPFISLEGELIDEIKAAFPATMTGYIVTLDPNAVNAEGVAGCQVKVDMTADIASAEAIVAEDGIEMEITDVVTGMTLTLGETEIAVVGGGVYTA
ncbi:MAG: hypothetical protein IJ466_04670 [Clostridia bacterium]|nr:hypothetical protein [Clostridia bacterium]